MVNEWYDEDMRNRRRSRIIEAVNFVRSPGGSFNDAEALGDLTMPEFEAVGEVFKQLPPVWNDQRTPDEIAQEVESAVDRWLARP